MPIVASIQTLSTAATKFVTAPGTLADKVTVILKNPSATIFIGGSASLTAANGLPLAATDSISLDLGPGDDLWMIASAATPTVAMLLTRQ